MTGWYKILLVAWVLTVPPVAALAYGFSGGHFVFPDVSVFGFWQMVDFIATSCWAVSPFVLAPFGLRFRGRRRSEPGLR